MNIRAIARFVALVLAVPALMFLAAGTVDWWQGWLVTIVTLTIQLGSRVLLMRLHPGLAAERAASSEMEGKDVASWDKALVPLVALVGPIASIIVAGLDRRWGWSPPVPGPVWLASLLLYIGGYLWSTWAMLTNRFFSAYVRIQREREHAVVQDGPYRVMRHPGYAGSVIGGLGCMLVLNSWWALVPAGLTNLAIVARTALEDSFLRCELPGYEEYARKVRYRLFPGVW